MADEQSRAVWRGILASTVATSTACCVIWHSRGEQGALTFAACYLLELSLSVDNMFAFFLLFEYFQTPPALQRIALTWGVTGAIVLRAAALVLGLAAIATIRPLLLVFAAALLYSAYGMLVGALRHGIGAVASDEDEDVSQKAVVRCVKRLIPVTSEYHDKRLFVREGGRCRYVAAKSRLRAPGARLRPL